MQLSRYTVYGYVQQPTRYFIVHIFMYDIQDKLFSIEEISGRRVWLNF